MIRPYLIALPLLVASLGCSSRGETARTTDRLDAGADVMVTAEPGSPGIMMDAKGAKGTFGPDMAAVNLGTRARVIDDQSPDDPADLDGRKARVQILEGEHAGLPGLVRRKNLVPIR